MKRACLILIPLLIVSSCVSTKETKSARARLRNEKKIAEQVVVDNAIAAKRYVIKFNRLYMTRGGIIDLVPKANYLILDGKKAIISAAYFGRQYDVRPIEGINMKGVVVNYNMKTDSAKGRYNITMKVANQYNSFNVYLTIGKDGSCNVSIDNIKIDQIRYSGDLFPIKDKNDEPDPKINDVKKYNENMLI